MKILLLVAIIASSCQKINTESIIAKKAVLIVKKVVGEKTAAKFFELPEMTLPPIPEVSKDVLSTDAYNLIDPRKDKMTKEQKERFYSSYIIDLYLSTMGSKPNRGEHSRWLNTLMQGSSQEGVYRGIVYAPVYARMENYDEPTSKKSAQLAHSLLLKYANKNISSQKLESFNRFTLKREVSEKLLEIFDVLSKNDDSVCRWYAILSSELASKFENKKLRSDHDAWSHYRWARSVSHKMIKGELIVKLHYALN